MCTRSLTGRLLRSFLLKSAIPIPHLLSLRPFFCRIPRRRVRLRRSDLPSAARRKVGFFLPGLPSSLDALMLSCDRCWFRDDVVRGFRPNSSTFQPDPPFSATRVTTAQLPLSAILRHRRNSPILRFRRNSPLWFPPFLLHVPTRSSLLCDPRDDGATPPPWLPLSAFLRHRRDDGASSPLRGPPWLSGTTNRSPPPPSPHPL
ncbi:hypothetical protein Taro_030866 [Colocasia esculenta]|uniref:Uncharacterized protein n=1 Tax=Colocasia esculenta TaxID=4460 RepID=A0A843W4M2_COLES|nr:hypothetical protein [Colocasia esculenta]